MDVFGLLLLLASVGGIAATVPVAQRKGSRAAVRVGAASVGLFGIWAVGLGDLLWEVGDFAVDFVTSLVFSPVVWLGVGALGLAAVLFVVSGRMSGPGGKALPAAGEAKPATGKAAQRKQITAKPADDPLSGFEDIEEILKKRGIG